MSRRTSRVPAWIWPQAEGAIPTPSVNEQGRGTWPRPSKLPVQDRFGGLAGHSRGGSMGVRSVRVVNGDELKQLFVAASGLRILQPRPLGVAGGTPRVSRGRFGTRPCLAAAPADCGSVEESHAGNGLIPVLDIERGRIADWAVLSLKVSRSLHLPRAPTPVHQTIRPRQTSPSSPLSGPEPPSLLGRPRLSGLPPGLLLLKGTRLHL